MPTVSLTMIVRNEEANLPGCLASCAVLFDEIIIVDTGSTDRTNEIAAAATDKHGRPARVFDFEWCDDFSAARNESLRRAAGDWVFWMDADDRIDDQNRAAISTLFEGLADRSLGYSLKSISFDRFNVELPASRQVRLFANRPDLRWSGIIHEDVLPAPDSKLVLTEIAILHFGYCSPSLEKQRLERNKKLLRKQLELEPGNQRARLHLAGTLIELGETHESRRMFMDLYRELDSQNARPVYWDKLLFGLALTSRDMNRVDEFEAATLALQDRGTVESQMLLQRLFGNVANT